MASASNNVQLVLTDGSVGAALFQIGSGIAITHQGQSVGSLSQEQLAELAAVPEISFGAVVADKIAARFPTELTDVTHRSLIQAADDWRNTHTI